MLWFWFRDSIRNICAHHGRLWNRELGFKPKIPRRDVKWHEPVAVTNSRIFGVLAILKCMLDDVASQSGWTDRLLALLEDYSDLLRGTAWASPTIGASVRSGSRAPSCVNPYR